MATSLFDEKLWSKEFKNPLWYLKLFPLYQEAAEKIKDLPDKEQDKIKTEFYSFIEQKLINGEIAFRLYAGHYYAGFNSKDPETFGKPISSGHVRDGKQVFWPYHWIIRADGKYERLLEDSETGWQSGKWDVNCRSVAIVFDEVNLKTVCPSNLFLGENGWKKKL